MSGLVAGRRYALTDVALYLVGVCGIAACLTLVFLGMRAVMNVGGFCAEGGPYVIETPCPEGVPLVLIGGIFGLFGFGGLMLWKGSPLGGLYAGLTALAWPALFLSLGWNFLEYAFNPPGPPGQGIVWGWLIPGIVFVLMGGVPLLALWPGFFGRSATSRPGSRAPVGGSGSTGQARARADLLAGMVRLRAQRERTAAAEEGLVDRLERLAELRRAGDLSDLEFEQAKRHLIDDARRA